MEAASNLLKELVLELCGKNLMIFIETNPLNDLQCLSNVVEP